MVSQIVAQAGCASFVLQNGVSQVVELIRSAVLFYGIVVLKHSMATALGQHMQADVKICAK